MNLHALASVASRSIRPALLLVGFAFPASAQSVTSPSWLPGDQALLPAVGDQTLPSLAGGNGGWLACWIDARQTVAGTGVAARVYATLLDAQSQALGASIEVSSGSSGASWVRAAWNEGAQTWLVVWNESRPTLNFLTWDVHAARISASGVLLDTTPLVIDGTDAIDEYYPDVASDGQTWSVFWMDENPTTSVRVVDAASISGSGAVSAPKRVYTPSSNLSAPYYPVAAFAGDRFVLAWFSWGSNSDDVYALRVSATLDAIGTRFTVCNAGGNQRWPEIAANGTDFYVVWQDNRLAFAQVFGTPVTAAAQVVVSNGALIDQNFGNPYPAVGWDGSNWIAAWDAYTTSVSDVRYTAISPSGVAAAPVTLTVQGAFMARPAVANGVGGACIAWADVGNTSLVLTSDIVAARVSASGAITAPHEISLSTPAQTRPDFALGVGESRMCAFLSESSGSARILAARLDDSGSPIDSAPFEIASDGGAYRNPGVAWDGDIYLFVWEQFTGAYPGDGGNILARRMRWDGTFLDPAPIQVLTGNDPGVAAVSGQFLVVATHEPTNHFRFIDAASVRASDGVVLDSPPLRLSGNYSVAPTVEAFSDRWMIAWEQHPSHDNPQCFIQTRTVLADDSQLSTLAVGSSASNGNERAPAIAINGSEAFVAWHAAGGDIRGRRVLFAGSTLDGSGTTLVSSAPDSQFQPAVTFNGTAWVCAWNDWRREQGVALGVGDIYGARIDSTLNVLDPTGFGIALATTFPEANPALTTGDGGTLVASADFRSGPFGSYRIALRRVDPQTRAYCFGDGSGTACPCGNASGVGAREGCTSSLAVGGKLGAMGVTSVSNDTFVLRASQMPNSSALYFQGTASMLNGAGVTFGDGLRCVGGSIIRLGVHQNANGASQHPSAGDALISVRGLVPLAGGTRFYQCWYRNSATFCTASTFNLTNGWEATWNP